MKIKLYHSVIAPDPGIPYICKDDQGIAMDDMFLVQYEQIRDAYIAARDNLIEAYKKAGGQY